MEARGFFIDYSAGFRLGGHSPVQEVDLPVEQDAGRKRTVGKIARVVELYLEKALAAGIVCSR